MVREVVRSLTLTSLVLVLSTRLHAQVASPPDSTSRLQSRSQVRVQLFGHGTSWFAGELGRALPSQCVIVMVNMSGDPRDYVSAYFTPSITRIERWRGVEQGTAGAMKADVSDSAEWAPYSLAALKQHEADEGCTDQNRNE